MSEQEKSIYPPGFLREAGILPDTLFFSLGEPAYDLPFKKPFAMLIYDELINVSSWSDIIVAMAAYIYKKMPQILIKYRDAMPHPFSIIKNRFAISCVTTSFRHGREFAKGLWIETNYSSQDCIRFASELASVAELDTKSILIYYGRKNENLPSKKELPESSYRTTELKPDHPKQESFLPQFTTALLCEFPNGFEYNNSSIRILENAAGLPCSLEDQKLLLSSMFKRHDGIYLLPEMVAKHDVIQAMKQRIEFFYTQFHAFSTFVLFDEFSESLHNLPNPNYDFRAFLLNSVLPNVKEKGKIFGKNKKQICIPYECQEQTTIQSIAGLIRDIIRQRGDAVLIDDVIAEIPCLNCETIESILREYISEAVEIRLDDMKYWKLLEHFCLPNDFTSVLSQMVNDYESQNIAPSLQAIANGLAIVYGEDFREIYAIDSDEVFKQIVQKTLNNKNILWKNNLLVNQVSKLETNIVDEYLITHNGIFHEQDFFEYAAEHRGLTQTTILICSYLRPRCVRLDQSHWIGISEFESKSDLSNDLLGIITNSLQKRLSGKSFLPIGNLPDAFFAEFAPIHIHDQVFYWNAYMLASIVELKVPNLIIINTNPSPYTVTAMLIPRQNRIIDGDVIDYIFSIMKKENRVFATADDVFEYLKENRVRMFKTKKLLDRINAFWGFENV